MIKTTTFNDRDIHFWPALINTKFDSSYDNVAYCSINRDFTSRQLGFFFGKVDDDGSISLPNVPEVAFNTQADKSIVHTSITLNYKHFKKIYDAFTKTDFDLIRCNYFLCDFNSIVPLSQAMDDKGEPTKPLYTYWFVDNVSIIFDNEDKSSGQITYFLTLDAAATFHDTWWKYNGVVNALRLTNVRWIKDNLFGTSLYIPDFQSNRFLTNCGPGCEQITNKFQKSQTTPMISSRYWDAEKGLPIETEFLKWSESTANAVVTSKKLFILLWLMRVDQYEDSKGKDTEEEEVAGGSFSFYRGDITNLNGYSIPMKLMVYIPSTDNGLPLQAELNTIINKIQVEGLTVNNDWPGVPDKDDPDIKKKIYRIVNASLCENLWADKTLTPALDASRNPIPNLYQPDENIDMLNYYSQAGEYEHFLFIDNQNFLWPAMFKSVSDIVSVEKLSLTQYDTEPHLFTNQHFETNITIFNKNRITFDISNLLINLNSEKYGFEKPKVYPGGGAESSYFTFDLMVRKGSISPDLFDIKYYLLDNDTSIAYKRDNNVLAISVTGDYSWPFFVNTYNDYILQSRNWRQAGIDNAEATYKAGRYAADMGLGKSILKGVVGGALGLGGTAYNKGAGMGAIGASGGIGGLLGGGMAGLFGGVFDRQIQLSNLRVEKENTLRSMNATYEDAKNNPSNINGGSPLTTQADIRFGIQKDDDFDPKNIKTLWSPSITFQQVIDYDCFTIAIDKNKNGYEQNRFFPINTWNDLMYRKFWNVVQMLNADEIFAKSQIQYEFVQQFVSRLIAPGGVRFWNLDTCEWDEIYQWDKNNYEKEFDEDLVTLEAMVIG